MDFQYILTVGTIIFLAGAAQSAVGFGYALFAIPPLVMMGVSLVDAITLIVTCSMAQAAIGAWKLRKDAPWRQALTATSVRVVSTIVGILVLKRLVSQDTATINMAVGIVLCALVVFQIVFRPKQHARLHWSWAGLAFTTSGLLAGTTGMGGPPLVVWTMAHDWSTRKVRGFLFATFVTAIPVQLIILYITFGRPVLVQTGIGLAFVPVVWLGAAVGMPIGNRLGRQKLRFVAYALLFVIGAMAIVKSL